MIKATVVGDTRKTLVLGLSRENTKRLHKGKPIHIHAEEVGMSGFDVILVAGETEHAIAAELQASGLWGKPETPETQ